MVIVMGGGLIRDIPEESGIGSQAGVECESNRQWIRRVVIIDTSIDLETSQYELKV